MEPRWLCRRGHITSKRRCAKCQKWDRLARQGVPEQEIVKRIDINERKLPRQVTIRIDETHQPRCVLNVPVLDCVRQAREAVQQFHQGPLSPYCRTKADEALMYIELALVCAKQALTTE